MLNWLTRQRRQLHGFYRDGFGRALGMTVLAFAAVMVVSYAVTMANAAPIERLMNLFREQIADRGIVDADGNFSAVKLFFNNFQACLLAVGYGFIPFLYLPAVSLGINAMMFGGFASYYVQQGLPLWYYGAGTLPHGVFELPALFMAALCAAQREGAGGPRSTESGAAAGDAYHAPADGGGRHRSVCHPRCYGGAGAVYLMLFLRECPAER